DGPGWTKRTVNGVEREFFDYIARGAPFGPDDGTVSPWVVIASLPFAPEIVIPATEEMHNRFGEYLYSSYGFLDSFNRSFNYDIPLKTGRLVPDNGWVSSDYIGIDQGPILAMITNYRNEFVWNVMKENPHIRRGLQRAGFQGGWLTPPGEPVEPPQADPEAAAARALGSAESRGNISPPPRPQPQN
ncbi:MAG TPA: glucoamylase family protein, partial [Pseudoxanthomonas sp.]|nr:glucoamylase family protein [Pseudoxanthomonas sp.]